MSRTEAPPLSFEALRQAGIAHAQEASSDLWTDYNLHDPGVTLLEQTCFALSELSYRADIVLRDLLTGPEGVLDFEGLGLFAAADVLRSAPVTLRDLETCLGALPAVARVHLEASGRLGLMRARVIPQQGFTPDQAADAVRAGFAAARPLCTDLGAVTALRAAPVTLGGRIVIGHRATPERVAAEVWLRVSLILRGTPLAERTGLAGSGATRADVARDPTLFEGRAPLQGVADRSVHIAALRQVPGLDEVQALDLRDADGVAIPLFRAPDRGSFLALEDPGSWAALTVVQDGVAVSLDAARLTREIDRLRAAFLSAEANRLDPADWAAPRSGVTRRFDYVPANATLPAIYTFRPDAPETRQLTGYRLLIDALLGAMTADLDHLPQFFAASPDQRVSHWPYRPGTPPGAALIASPAAWDGAFARHDRWQDRRVQVLDLLIALQGESMPSEGRSGIDADRPAAGRADDALRRRARFLRALPGLNRRRGTGPDAGDPGGVLLKLACLADLPVTTPAAIRAAEAAAGFSVVPEMAPGSVPRDAVAMPDDPLDLLVPDRAAPALDMTAVHDAMPWLAEDGLTAGALARAPLADAWLVAPDGPRGWRVLFDADAEGALYPAGPATEDPADRATAVAHANGLRAAFAQLTRAQEGAWLLEDIRLRGASVQYAAHTATLVLTGWGPRCAAPAYRRHVARLIERVAPAHCRIRPLWLAARDFAGFAAAYDAWQQDMAAGPDLAAFLADLEAPA